MPTTLTNGIQLPDKGSVDWYNSMQSNYNLIDTHLGDTDVHVTAEDKANWNSKQGSLSQAQLDAIAQVSTNTSDIATLQSGKANTSHTHSSSDITDIGDYATKTYVDNSISGLVDNAPAALDTLKELSTALNDDANFASTVTTALSAKANSADLATIATSGSYNDLTNKPTINDSTITIQKNGSTVDTFTTNGSNKTINIPVPTKTSDLTNDSNFVDTSNSAVASGITSTKVTDYDTHIADTDIHVTSADKTTWNTVTSKADDANVMHLSGNESASGDKNFRGLLTTIPSSSLWPAVSNTSDDITLLGRSVVHLEQLSSGRLTDLSGGAWNVVELGTGAFFFRNNTGTDIRYKHLDTGVVSRIPVVSGANRYINDLNPNQDNTYNLGSSSLRWRSINDINPGALSLPDLSNGVDISGYITLNSDSSYTPLSDGYIYICCYSSSACGLWVRDSNNNGVSTRSIGSVPTYNNLVSICIPVVKNVSISIFTPGCENILTAKFYPCQGNV